MIYELDRFIRDHIWGMQDIYNSNSDMKSCIWHCIIHIFHEYCVSFTDSKLLLYCKRDRNGNISNNKYHTELPNILNLFLMIDHLAYTHPKRREMIQIFEMVSGNYIESILIPFLDYLSDVNDNYTFNMSNMNQISLNQIIGRDSLIFHFLARWTEIVSSRPIYAKIVIIPYIDHYCKLHLNRISMKNQDNNGEKTEAKNESGISSKDVNMTEIMALVHQLFIFCMNYPTLRWIMMNYSNDSNDSNDRNDGDNGSFNNNFISQYFVNYLIAIFPNNIDFSQFQLAFLSTFSINLDKINGTINMTMDDDDESKNNENENENEILKNKIIDKQYQLKTMQPVFQKMCVYCLEIFVDNWLDYCIKNGYKILQWKENQSIGKNYKDIIRLIMVTVLTNEMISIKDLNKLLYLVENLVYFVYRRIRMIHNDSDKKNELQMFEQLLNEILVILSSLIANCTDLIRKDHCVKWFFKVNDAIHNPKILSKL